mmetsp:Transcript_11151/g.23807  ORF Transcript_11151/g.23807 Transcript_11151/m.23807 type:complete len:214 (+) Transcript_11151:647-1288(+)
MCHSCTVSQNPPTTTREANSTTPIPSPGVCWLVRSFSPKVTFKTRTPTHRWPQPEAKFPRQQRTRKGGTHGANCLLGLLHCSLSGVFPSQHVTQKACGLQARGGLGGGVKGGAQLLRRALRLIRRAPQRALQLRGHLRRFRQPELRPRRLESLRCKRVALSLRVCEHLLRLLHLRQRRRLQFGQPLRRALTQRRTERRARSRQTLLARGLDVI